MGPPVPFAGLQGASSPEFSLDMSETLWYILPVSLACKVLEARDTRVSKGDAAMKACRTLCVDGQRCHQNRRFPSHDLPIPPTISSHARPMTSGGEGPHVSRRPRLNRGLRNSEVDRHGLRAVTGSSSCKR